MKILVVDDSVMDRKLNTHVLKKSGMDLEILEAKDGQDGLIKLKENAKDINLVLLDWQMPNVDGLEFMRQMIGDPEIASTPIIMITASSSDDNKQAAYAVNPNLTGYITKPYQPNQLVNLVKEACNR